jgi:spermidine/putrescine transport system permease protein
MRKGPLLLALIGPFVLYNLTFVLVPLLTVLQQSLYPMGADYTPGQQMSLANFKQAFAPANLEVMARSARYALATTSCCVLLGYPLAYYIAFYGGRLRSALLVLVVMPFWTSYLVRTYAWKTLLQTEGVLNGLLSLLPGHPHLAVLNTQWAVILGLTYGFLPFATLPIYVSLEGQDRSLGEAAADLGATPWQTFTRVILPLSLPGVISGSLITFVPAMGDFVAAELLGGPDNQMIGCLIQQEFLALFNWPMGSALALVLMVLMMLSLAAYLRLSPEVIRERE